MDWLMYLVVYGFVSVLLGVLAGAIAQKKGHSFAPYFLAGALLPLVGLLLAGLAGEREMGRNSPRKACPYCGTGLPTSLMVCSGCGRAQPVTATATTAAWERTISGADDVAKWAEKNPKDG